jgi:hypothetical protein
VRPSGEADHVLAAHSTTVEAAVRTGLKYTSRCAAGSADAPIMAGRP